MFTHRFGFVRHHTHPTALALLWGLLLIGGSPSARANNYMVSNLNDSGPGSLRQAILDANARAGVDRILFAAGLTGIISLTSALPALTDDLVIKGPGANLLMVARSEATGTPAFRLFTNDSHTIFLSGLSITGGYVSGAEGGGIYNAGVLSISDCIISGNWADTRVVLPGPVGVSGLGGGIYNAGTLSLAQCSITGNLANQGGGIMNDGAATLTDCTINGNRAVLSCFSVATPAVGGGIYNSGTLYATQCSVAGNSANTGGGIVNNSAATLLICSVSGNRAYQGGGAYNHGPVAILTLQSSSVTNNAVGNVLNDFGGAVLWQ